MGLRSPQEMEQVRHAPTQTTRVEAGKAASVDLTPAAENYMLQKSLADQDKALKENIKIKKDSLIRIRSQYAVEEASRSIKERMAALKGDNALKKVPELLEEAVSRLQSLGEKAPEGMRTQLQVDIGKKLQELQSQGYAKSAVEGQKAAIDNGKAMTKLHTWTAASNFLDPVKFKEQVGYARLSMVDLSRIEGKGDIAASLSGDEAGSNAVVKGVEFTLSQSPTPDSVANARTYYEEVILKDNDLFVSQEDRIKIEKAFKQAEDKAKDNLAFYLADAAIGELEQKGITEEAAYDFIFNNANQDPKVIRDANGLFQMKLKVRQADIDRRDNDYYGQMVEELEKGNITSGMRLLDRMSPDGDVRRKAQQYIRDTQAGTADLFNDPKDLRVLNDLLRSNPDTFLEVVNPYDKKYMLTPEQRNTYANAKLVLQRDKDSKNFALNNGSVLSSAYEQARRYVLQRTGKDPLADPAYEAQIKDTVDAIYYELRAKNPNMVESGVLLGHVRARVETDLFKDSTTTNLLGRGYQRLFGKDPSNVSILGVKPFVREETLVRDRRDFPVRPQTGLGVGRSEISGKLVPDPTQGEIEAFIRQYKEAYGKDISPEKAKEAVIKVRERNISTPNSGASGSF